MMYLAIFSDIWHAIKSVIENILNFVRGIFQGILDIAKFITNLIEDTLNALKYILKAFDLINDSLGLLPSFLIGICTALIGVYVCYQILGRESGGK